MCTLTATPKTRLKTYAILDEQSNRSLAKTELFDDLDIHGQEIEYTLASCAGTIVTSGRRAGNCIVEFIDGSARLQLPTVIECNQIPEVREEIPSPEIAEHYPHLSDITNYIPPVEMVHHFFYSLVVTYPKLTMYSISVLVYEIHHMHNGLNLGWGHRR